MKYKHVIFLAVGIYVFLLATINTGAANANFREEFPRLCKDPRWARENFAYSVMLGIFPPTSAVTPFMTGFYMDGLDWHWTACE